MSEPRPHVPVAWLWKAQLAVGLAAVATYVLLPASEEALQWAYVAVGGYGMASVIVGLRHHRPSSPMPWWLLVLGISAWLLGDGLYFWVAGRSGGAPFPSVADVAYYTFFPLVGLALLLTLRRRLPGGDRAGLIDALLLTVGAGGLSWVYLMAPYARDQELSLPAQLASVGYPLGDLLLLALLARLLLSPGRRVLTFRLLVASFVLTLVSDAWYGVQSLAGTYVTGGLLDVGWLLAYVLWGTAALHPSMDELTQRVPLDAAGPSRRRLATMALAALTSPLLLIVQVQRGETTDVPVLAGGCLVMFVLVLVRLGGVLDQLQRQSDDLQRAVEQLDRVQAERKVLLQRTVEVGERERTRLAADLHDGPIQRLSAVALQLDRALLRLDRHDVTAAAELLERGHEGLSAEVEALRRVMRELRPPVLDEAGLAAGVADLLEQFTARTGVQVQSSLTAMSPLDAEDETVLYRVVQEALTNVGKHAGAARVSVRLEEQSAGLELTVADDGCGFEPRPSGTLLREGHFGLTGMQERLSAAGGRLVIDSAPQRGTRVRACLPTRLVVPQQRPVGERTTATTDRPGEEQRSAVGGRR